jgi:hypothetical protein
MKRALPWLLLLLAATARAGGPQRQLGASVPLGAGAVRGGAAAASFAPIPALPQSLVGVAGTGPLAAAAGADETRLTAASFEGAASAEAGSDRALAALNARFDKARGGSNGAEDDATVPPGVVHVDVRVVRDAADVDRLIPRGQNSDSLIQQLKAKVRRMAPYRVYTYYDSLGGSFTAIDLSQNPSLIDHFPEQHSHEIQLVKKIQLWNKDLQLVVREDDATPDIVMGGVMTELKSLLGDGSHLTERLTKANGQVRAHAERHALGHGAVVVDLTRNTQVPTSEILTRINQWAASKRDLVLDRIFVFAGADVMLFEKGPGRVFTARAPTTMPLVRRLPGRGKPTVRGLLAASGARARVAAISEAAASQNDADEASFAADAQKLLGQVSKNVARGRHDDALGAWEAFLAAYGERARALEPRVLGVIAKARALRPK